MRILVLAGLLAIPLYSLSAPAAQTETGTVSGTVKDPAGGAIPGARVELSNAGLTTQTRTTDAGGAFRFDRVAVGRYDLTITLAGFPTYQSRVVVGRNANVRLSVVLQASGLAESVTVNSAAPPAQPVAGSLADSSAARKALPAPSAPSSTPAPPWWPMPYGRPDFNTESYDHTEENVFHDPTSHPLSTFSIDVDTASYANVRRFLNGGTLPPPDAVRIEELINYFRFEYPAPTAHQPFSVTTEIAPCPWNPEHRLALIGLQAKRLDEDNMPARNLVFLLDVSGSMEPPDKLPLVRTAMRMLVDTLTPRDRIAIVVYAGASGVVLPSTSGAHKERIHEAIARLEAGGSTNGGAGIQLAYRIAEEQFIKGGINRVILATDGDFNVGVTNPSDLVRLIEQKRATGIFLSVLGVGTGNLKDSTMEKLADRGNGNYAYLDSLQEARKVLVKEAGATLVTVAKDVKIQIEFNPVNVASYRLIGYENRLLRKEDFNDDRKDAGEIGAGHTVTALYEIVPHGAKSGAPRVDPLKYQQEPEAAGLKPRPTEASRDEMMTVKLRYKAPDGNESRLIAVPVKNRSGELSPNIGFAAAVAEFGMLLRQSGDCGDASHAGAAALARRYRGSDPDGYRTEFVKLVELADALSRQTRRDSVIVPR
jgi:Ca-activated chloride channel family protein